MRLGGKSVKMNNSERIGVSYVQLIINRDMEWIFRELNVQDFGIDAHIEIMGKTYATGKLIGVQIKCGQSYFKESDNDNVIFRFDKKHFQYWINYSIPVIIILVKPDLSEVVWEVINDETAIKGQSDYYKICINRENKFNKYATKRLVDISQGKKQTVSNKMSEEVKGVDYFELGYKYEFGADECAIDYKKARYYYKLAADNDNDKIAQFNYALLLLHGKGGAVDYAQSYFYMKKSAMQEFVPAQYNLGLLFFHGKILYKKNIKEAQKWLNKAKESGHENANVWLMYCELFKIIYEMKTLNIELKPIPFADSFSGFINKISVRDLKLVLKNDIKQSSIVRWKKGLFYIASQAELNAPKYYDLESTAFWRDFQKCILLYELISEYYNYNFELFITNIKCSELENAWKRQKEENGKVDRPAPIFAIADNEIKHESSFLQFWKHVKKCSDLLLKIEENKHLVKRQRDISIEILKKSCTKIKVAIKNISFTINENNDIRVRGNVEEMEGYKAKGKLIIKADLCDLAGRTLYVLREYGEIKLHLSGYDSFELSCSAVERFVDLESFCKIRVYPTIE